MNNDIPRQRVKKESKRIDGKVNSLSFDSEEHSVFLEDGSITTKINSNSPVVQGIVSQNTSDIVSQCQTCLNFATAQMHNICQSCSSVVCSICAIEFEKTIACPVCNKALERRRWILIVKKLFIDPFVERVG